MNEKFDFDTIMNTFEFEIVHRYMKEEDIKYAGDSESPSVEELKKTATALYHRALAEMEETGEVTFVGSGGFQFTITPNRQMELRFLDEIVSNIEYGQPGGDEEALHFEL